MNLFKRAATLAVTQEAAIQQVVAKEEYKEQQVDVNFREEVIEELVILGFARHVAANMTDTQVKLMAKAREIGYI